MRKKIVTIVFVFLFSVPLFSQNSTETRNKFLIEFSEQKYTEAVETGKQFLNEATQKDTNYIHVLRYMAFSYYSMKDYENAMQKYQETKDLISTLQGKDNNDYIMVTYNLAVNESYLGKYSLAFPLMKEVLDYIVAKQTKNCMDYINTSIQEANIYNMAGCSDKAEEVYEDVFAVIKNNYKEQDTLYMQMVNTLAPFYLQHGKYDKAEPFYARSVELMEKMYGKSNTNYFLSLNSLGEFYLYAGMYPKMEKVFSESVELSRTLYGKNSADYATSLNNLAVAYEKQGKNKEAEDLYIQCLKIKKNVYKKESDFYALTLSNFAVLYDNMGRYDESEKLLNEALAIYKKVYGESNPNYPVAMTTMASVYSASGKYEQAIKLMEQAAELQKKFYGEKYDAYVNTLNGIANTYEQLAKYDSAEIFYEKTVQLRKEIQGAEHPDYATALTGLANIKSIKGEYKDAEQLLKEALGIFYKTVGENHASYLNCLNSLAVLYSTMGNYALAGELYEKCRQKFEKVYGDMHPEYATFLNNLGLFYYESGDFNQAEKTLRKSLEIQETDFGKDHPDNINMLTNLANVLIKKGNYKEAEALLLESINITREKLGTNHPNYITSVLSLGVFYYETGNYEKAETYYLEAAEKYKAVYGEKNKDYASTLNDLGALYLERMTMTKNNEQAVEWSTKAEKYFTQSLVIDSLLSGAENPDYALHLNNLAEFYRNTGQFEKSEKLYKKNIEIERNIFGETNPSIAVTYNNLGLLYISDSLYDKAKEYLMKSLKIKQTVYGEKNPACSEALSSLAYVYELTNDMADAEKCYVQSLSMNYELVNNNFSFLSEEEKANYLATIYRYNDMFASFALKYKKTNPAVTDDLYNNLLVNKGILLRSSEKIRNTILNGKNKELIQKYDRWLGERQQLAKLYSLPEQNRYQSVKELEDSANSMEKELVSASYDYVGKNQADWASVKNSLKENEAAIEFGHFKRLEKDNNYSDNYYAMIITSQCKHPLIISLFEAPALEKVIEKDGSNSFKHISALYASDDLYRLIWQPFDSLLKGITAIYLSPVGLLNKISFASIMKTEHVYISDQYDINMVSSTKQLTQRNGDETLDKNPGITIFGGAKFSDSNEQVEGWKYLEGTLTELEKIQTVFNNAKLPVTVFSGNNASEENFKKLSASSSLKLIHVATHGYFFPDPNEKAEPAEISKTSEVVFRGGSGMPMINGFINSTNPLLRSGLVLAHANNAFTQSNANGEDGILTAYEVSNLSLDNTQLMVLSACETGLGDIKGSEGVYGLQRAFKIAGVKFVMMSLWQVPDKETVEFMETFYTKLLSLKNIRNAFIDTQKEMRKKYEPYYWGAFVLME